MKTKATGLLARPRTRRHDEALKTSSFLTVVFRQMYRPMAAKIAPKKVVKVLKEAGVVGLLLGTHGIGGWRSQARATQDVDLLIKKRDHAKAVRAIREAFPKLEVDDTRIVTRFLDASSGTSIIDLMKPSNTLFKVAFQYSIAVGDTHRVPELELALVTKYAAMVSPNRPQSKKLVDAGDFFDMVESNLADIDLEKVQELARMVFPRGSAEVTRFIRDIEAGRKLEF